MGAFSHMQVLFSYRMSYIPPPTDPDQKLLFFLLTLAVGTHVNIII